MNIKEWLMIKEDLKEEVLDDEVVDSSRVVINIENYHVNHNYNYGKKGQLFRILKWLVLGLGLVYLTLGWKVEESER